MSIIYLFFDTANGERILTAINDNRLTYNFHA